MYKTENEIVEINLFRVTFHNHHTSQILRVNYALLTTTNLE